MFILASTILFFFLGVIWQRTSWLNLILKLVFFGMGAWGVFTLYHLRFIVR